ncbi:hypothetical protein EVAR_61132_1 [Eumeta japonica]|uniref:Uncharacterized protein n=1 Tax=Eumeta variegata TaxID=151549 RepID=A0A4C2A9S2_EUMVA|nr:hypothetical protein EVAR_61132_1 [Eumeta japonica]
MCHQIIKRPPSAAATIPSPEVSALCHWSATSILSTVLPSGSRPIGRLGESIPAQGMAIARTIPDPGKWQPGICPGEPINAEAFRGGML